MDMANAFSGNVSMALGECTCVKNRLLKPSNPFYIFILVNYVTVLIIKAYQKISKDREHCCNMIPSCSEFCKLAFEKYDFLYATRRTIQRLLACAFIIEDWPIENLP